MPPALSPSVSQSHGHGTVQTVSAFAALMTSLGFHSLPKGVSRGFQAWGCLAVGTVSSSRLEGGGHAGGSGSAWPWLWQRLWGACASLWVERGLAGQLREAQAGEEEGTCPETLSSSASKEASTIWCLCTPVKVEGGGGQGLCSATDIPLPSFVLQEVCASSLPGAAAGSIATRCGSHAFFISPAALGAASAACRAGSTNAGTRGSELGCAPSGTWPCFALGALLGQDADGDAGMSVGMELGQGPLPGPAQVPWGQRDMGFALEEGAQ